LPPQVGGVAAFAGWLLEHEAEIGCRFDAFDLRGAATGAGGVFNGGAVLRQLRLAPHYVSWLRRRRPAIHYCVALTPTGFLRDFAFVGLARASGQRLIANVHNVSDLDRLTTSRLRRLGLRLIARWSAAVVVIAERAVERLAEIGVESRCIHLAQRFDDAEPRPVFDNRDLKLLFVGAYGAAKGVDELLSAVAGARANGHEVALTIVGGELHAGEHERLQALARSLGIDERVRFTGSVPPETLALYFRSADAICLPSHREGFPMALLEGMAFGLPPVATPVGGIPELIEDGVSGLLVPVGDVAALTGAIERLVDPGERERLAAAAWKRSREFGADRAVVAWRETYAAASNTHA
jgi:glycosyltransferase involved in cell wall biosynthesis